LDTSSLKAFRILTKTRGQRRWRTKRLIRGFCLPRKKRTKIRNEFTPPNYTKYKTIYLRKFKNT